MKSLPIVSTLPGPKTLTLDLGTHTGWTLLEHSRVIASGTQLLATPEELVEQRKAGGERTLDVRFSRLLSFISGHLQAGVQRIVFEDVQFAKTQAQVQVWTSLRCAIWAAVQHRPIEIRCVQVGTLKLFATGSGGAQKQDMAQALVQAEPAMYQLADDGSVIRPDGTKIDDNEVDAIWLARFTEAVDRGKQAFLSEFERRAAAKVLRRTKKAERRTKRKARKEAARLALRAKREARRATRRLSRIRAGIKNQRKGDKHETTQNKRDEPVLQTPVLGRDGEDETAGPPVS